MPYQLQHQNKKNAVLLQDYVCQPELTLHLLIENIYFISFGYIVFCNISTNKNSTACNKNLFHNNLHQLQVDLILFFIISFHCSFFYTIFKRAVRRPPYQLRIHYIFQHNFFRTMPDIVHNANPLHLIL